MVLKSSRHNKEGNYIFYTMTQFQNTSKEQEAARHPPRNVTPLTHQNTLWDTLFLFVNNKIFARMCVCGGDEGMYNVMVKSPQ